MAKLFFENPDQSLKNSICIFNSDIIRLRTCLWATLAVTKQPKHKREKKQGTSNIHLGEKVLLIDESEL